MRKTKKLLAVALAILLAFSTTTLSLTAFAQRNSLAQRIEAYTGDLSDDAGAALANDYKAASDEEKDAAGAENVLKMARLARARVQATNGWFPNYPVNIPKLIGNPTEKQLQAAALYQQVMGRNEVEGVTLTMASDFTQAGVKAALAALNATYQGAEQLIRDYLGILDHKGEYWDANQNFTAFDRLAALNLTADVQQNPFRAQEPAESQAQYEAAKKADEASRYWNALTALGLAQEQDGAITAAQKLINSYQGFLDGKGIEAVKAQLTIFDALNDMQKSFLSGLTQPVAVLEGEAYLFTNALLVIRNRVLQTQSPGVKPAEKPFAPGSITYPSGITQQQTKEALNKSDAFLMDALNMLVPAIGQAGGLKPYAKGQVATGAMTGQALAAIYTQLDAVVDGAIADLPGFVQMIVKELIGNALLPAGVAEQLTEAKYAQANAALAEKGLTWQNTDLAKVSWGFADGDMEGFVDAVIAGLRPVTKLLFGTQLLSLLGVDIAFENKTDKDGNYQYGLYEKLFIPIYDALGVTDALTSVAYTKQTKQAIDATGQYDAYLKLALSPLLPLIDRLLDKPVDTLTEKLPHLIYESDTAFEAIRSACRSIGFGLEDMVAPYLSLDGLFGLAANAVKNLTIGGQTVSLELPKPDWKLLSSLGSLAAVPTAGADYAQKYAVEADQPAVFVELLRYVERTVSQNRAEIERLLGTIDGIEEFLPLIQEVLKTLTEKDALTSLVIELLAPPETGPSNPGGDDNADPDDQSDPSLPDTDPDANSGGADDSMNDGEDEEDLQNPDTGDAAVSAAVLLAVAAGAGVMLMLSRKRSAKKTQ